MEQAKYDLRNFSRELNDVNMACNLNINTGDFLSFADYFFDGFVVDWMVQDRINNARHQVEEAIRRTEYIINQLQYISHCIKSFVGYMNNLIFSKNNAL